MYESNIKKIISGNEQLTGFWGNCHGWAPNPAADLMSKSRLDWQVSLSKTLLKWTFDEDTYDGELILAWANLGALVEGSLKLLLSVYYEDYSGDVDKLKNRKGEQIDPDVLAIEKLKQFFKKKDLLNEEWFPYIDLVQQRRNAIHAYKNRPIGDHNEFREALEQYLQLLRTINQMLPYPDNMNEPQF
ncbi:hypothetical protein UA38_01695 [Photobacterium kishitanii]|uniref:Apea-like HEPN domain-containing protein n=1 Tax=Photobacterium kishitanii TaxID=318456 RepID=A0AAX0YXL1_9GAMM|nr:hypothetical protein [Photobacterium kishitanii]KJG59886.1 hypothetical protein UA38_01695 [Photobacterium kishitanii]KJG63169.1 hypothetical protein UA42_02080 [Photobacterium kishitanii]KJG67821.1 hypothetical protein UA40_00765 [Photobacterium kishitanii]KJG71340.1 hypothetical protein UA41_01710 [Photobacterium kishitanii]PSX20320.1 hypothetical protein C0W70_05465 [Photobacterium kishitanii]